LFICIDKVSCTTVPLPSVTDFRVDKAHPHTPECFGLIIN
jgi:hypothetical protein